MPVVLAMSKIATLKYKNKKIDAFIRERRGKHPAPYIVVVLPDGKEAHITIKNKKVFDDSIQDEKILNFVKKWIDAYSNELMASWAAAAKGKALAVPSVLPRSRIEGFVVKKIKKIKPNEDWTMLIDFEDENETKCIDFKKDVIPHNTAFTALNDIQVFMGAKASISAVRWDSLDIDIEAADLYDIAVPSYTSKIAGHYDQ